MSERLDMKIRNGFVTNSSSTNFIIISKEEITEDFLFDKLGFKKDSPFASMGWELCYNLLYRPDEKLLNYDDIAKDFGVKTAQKWNKLTQKGFYSIRGCANSDEETLTSFFAMDSFEINEQNFYLNGKNCIW